MDLVERCLGTTLSLGNCRSCLEWGVWSVEIFSKSWLGLRRGLSSWSLAKEPKELRITLNQVVKGLGGLVHDSLGSWRDWRGEILEPLARKGEIIGEASSPPSSIYPYLATIETFYYDLSFETRAQGWYELTSVLKPDGKGMKEACLDKMMYVQDNDTLKQMQGRSRVMLNAGQRGSHDWAELAKLSRDNDAGQDSTEAVKTAESVKLGSSRQFDYTKNNSCGNGVRRHLDAQYERENVSEDTCPMGYE
ncbi:hypothetical protein Acr_06g0009660 [Actinidia rufa]|uniref:Uncharacterized protein n=1 Tax=Actinidia rufa TaxID=165716 RepID=A0A7J0ES35_9ERIC|nr:hypothetical protein Acr_06g0009660 [Actinidia rufa]